MRPLLKISCLTQLHDARSSAAVGFDIIGFCLDRGNARKLPVSLVWNIVNWVSGPRIELQLNAASPEELSEAKETFSFSYVNFPLEEWDPRWLDLDEELILRAEGLPDREAFLRLQSLATPAEKTLLLELHFDTAAEAAKAADWAEDSFFHFASIEEAEAYIRQSSTMPYGICFREEAEEEDGLLNYERMDLFLDHFFERFPSETNTPA